MINPCRLERQADPNRTSHVLKAIGSGAVGSAPLKVLPIKMNRPGFAGGHLV
jgi:hypothetical protein